MKQTERRVAWWIGLIAVIGLAQASRDAALLRGEVSPTSGHTQVRVGIGKLPFYFESNRGQAPAEVRFLARGPDATLFLTSQEAILSLSNAREPSRRQVVHLRFVGANPAPHVAGIEPLPGRSNYFVGNDPRRWRTNIPHYARVRYREVYPGVDVVFYGSGEQLEYDFVVAPGADPNRIRLEFAGVDRMETDRRGNLVLHTGSGQIVQRVPAIYQESEGIRRTVPGGYARLAGSQVAFQVSSYDAREPLILDPILEYSRFFGGSKEDEIISLAVDGAGNAYLTGETSSPDLPTTSGALPHPASVFQTAGNTLAFVAKLNPTGSALIYCTYLGGSKTSVGHNIKVDSVGNAYVGGRTQASDFPTMKPFQATHAGGTDDAFISKLNPAGSALLYSTYLGGNSYDQVRGLAVDSAGSAYLTGHTRSTNFPTAKPLQAAFGGGTDDAFVAKLNAAGSALVYSTYLGGSGADNGHAITVDASGNAYLTGLSNSPNFPTAKPFQASFRGGEGNDTIIVKVNASGSALVYSTYLGGSKSDESRGIVVDSAGNAIITGYTQSSDFPTAKPLQGKFAGGSNDAFLTALSPDGAALVFSTFLGGTGGDFGRGLALDSARNIYLTGYTESKDFPTKNPFQAAYAGGTADSFAVKLNPAGSALLYSTYLGGSAYERGRAIAVDAAGNAYISGRTESKDFPTTKSLPTKYGGGANDAYVVKVSEKQP